MKHRPDVVPTPSSDSEQTSETFYHCQNCNLAAYIVAAKLLRLFRVQLTVNGKAAEYLFLDPQTIGDELMRRYKVADCEAVNAKILFEARRYLLGQQKRLQLEAARAAGVANAKR